MRRPREKNVRRNKGKSKNSKRSLRKSSGARHRKRARALRFLLEP